jgi:hypothetical protein
MTTRKPRGGKGKAPARAAPKPVFDRRLMDQQLAAVGRLLAEQEFDSIEEANAYLQQALVGGELVAPGPTTPWKKRRSWSMKRWRVAASGAWSWPVKP